MKNGSWAGNDDGEDPLRPARGFRNGAIISLLLWAVIIWLLFC
jgi:hypothetical protein